MMKKTLPWCAMLVVACGAEPPNEGGPSPAGDIASMNPAVESTEIRGALLHEEWMDNTHVEFRETDTGVVAIATGPLGASDPEAILDRLHQPSVSEAVHALRGAEAITKLRPELLAAENGELPAAENRELPAASLQGAPAADQLPPEPAQKPAAPSGLGDFRLAAAPAGWVWQNDYNAFSDQHCAGASDCRVGFTWLYSGHQLNMAHHQVLGFNHSFDGPAEFGSRYAYNVNGTLSWVTEFRQSVPARTWISLTRYGVVGPLRRDAWISGKATTNLTASTPTFTATNLNPDPRTSMAQRNLPFQMRGRSNFGVGTTYSNRCATDVKRAFQNLPSSPSARIRYKSQSGNVLPPTQSELPEWGRGFEHLQGFARLAGVDDGRWAVVTGDSGLIGGTGVFLVHLGDVSTGGLPRWVEPGQDFTGDPPALRGTKFFYPISGTQHPGGLQASGRTVVIASEAPEGQKSFVDFFDFTTPGAARHIQRFTLFGNQAEPVAPARPISGAGLTQLADGRFLLFVLGQDTGKNGWFYISDTTLNILPTTRWSFLDYVSSADTVPSSAFRKYQNVTMINECTTGDMYMVATNNADLSVTSDGQDYADLFQITASGSVVTLTHRAARNFNEGSGGFCTFRAAASVFIDNFGEAILYCHTRNANSNWWTGAPDSKLKFAEFAY